MITIKGTKPLIGKLKKLAELDDVKEVVKTHTTNMQRDAQRKAPVDTGFLKRSISISFEDGGFTGIVKAAAEYSGYVEYGTRFMSAQPFFRPAWQPTVTAFKSDMSRLMK